MPKRLYLAFIEVGRSVEHVVQARHRPAAARFLIAPTVVVASTDDRSINKAPTYTCWSLLLVIPEIHTARKTGDNYGLCRVIDIFSI